jgi:hypothetical protein
MVRGNGQGRFDGLRGDARAWSGNRQRRFAGGAHRAGGREQGAELRCPPRSGGMAGSEEDVARSLCTGPSGHEAGSFRGQGNMRQRPEGDMAAA